MILVTGGTGLVGSHLLFDLCNKGKRVKALKRRSSSIEIVTKLFQVYSTAATELLNLIEWVEGDVLDYLSLEKAMKGVDFVYHCAAVVSFDPRDKAMMMQINAGGTANVVNAALAAKITKLCFVSSVAALGREGENLMVDETSDWIDSPGNSAYAISKYAAEREVWRGITEGLSAVIVNPSIIIGTGDAGKSSVQLLKRAMKGNAFYTEGVNAFVDVRDVARAMILLMDSNISGERFILSAGNYSYREVFNYMAEGFGNKKPHLHVKPWIFSLLWRIEKIRSWITGSAVLITKETAHTSGKKYLYSNQKIRAGLGFEFLPVEQSIRNHCAFFSTLAQQS